MKIMKAIEKGENLINHAKSLENWFSSQRWGENSTMPKDARINSAIQRIIDDAYNEGYDLLNKVSKAVEHLEIDDKEE